MAMLVVFGFNLIWVQRLVHQEFCLHMEDQAGMLAGMLAGLLAEGSTAEEALERLSSWQGRLHELEVVGRDGRVLVSTRPHRVGEPAGPAGESEEGFSVLSSLPGEGEVAGLRLWMPTARVSQAYLKATLVNLAGMVVAGTILFALIWVVTTRVGSSYEDLLDRVSELERAHARTARLKAMGQMAAGVAHEIRNPLNALGIGLQRIRSEVVPVLGSDAGRWGENVERLYGEVQRVNGIVEDFLDLARPPKLVLSEGSVSQLVENLVETYRSEAEKAGVRLEVEGRDSDARAYLDRDRLGQVVVNLLKNGIEAAARREEGAGRVAVCVTPGDGGCRIDVADDGPEPPEEELDQMFDAFYTTKPQGTGLGLPLARQIVEAHGGTLRAARSEGRTVLSMSLPSKRRASSESEGMKRS